MALVVTEAELVRDLTTVLASYLGTRFIGLFQNDWTPRRVSTIAEVVPANFSGYSGLQALFGWSAAALVNQVAISRANPVAWVHGAGTANNWIFGYYVVDPSGNLCWAERDPTGPIAVVNPGQVYLMTPQFSSGSRY